MASTLSVTHTPFIKFLLCLCCMYHSSLGRYGFTLELNWLHKNVILLHSLSDSSVHLHVECAVQHVSCQRPVLLFTFSVSELLTDKKMI